MTVRRVSKKIKKDWRLYVAAAILGALWIVVWTSTWSSVFRVCEPSAENVENFCRPLGPSDVAVWLTIVIAAAFAAPYAHKYIKKLSIPGVGEVEAQDKLPPDEDVTEENNAVDEKAEEYRRWLKNSARHRREDQS